MTTEPCSEPSRSEFLSSLVTKKLVIEEDEQNERDLTNPVYKQASRLYGDIRRMTLDKLREQLRQLGVEEKGSADSCRRRLKNCVQNSVATKLGKKNTLKHYYDIVCVIDFEATCERDVSDQVQEIIEFPAFIVDLNQRSVVSTFHEFVKPKGVISEFCTELTGITTSVIEKADDFETVIDRFEDWLFKFIKMNNVTSFAFATDGPWDIAHFFARQCQLNNIRFPEYAKRWINVKKLFASYYKQNSSSLTHIMAYLGIEFEGRPHSGYDDTHNIASVLIRMLHDGANPVINERISWHSAERTCWGNLRCGYVRIFYNKQSNGLVLSDSEDSDFDN